MQRFVVCALVLFGERCGRDEFGCGHQPEERRSEVLGVVAQCLRGEVCG